MKNRQPLLFFKSKEGLLDFNGAEFINGRIRYAFDNCKAESSMSKWSRNGDSCFSMANNCTLGVRIDRNKLALSVENNSKENVFLETIPI